MVLSTIKSLMHFIMINPPNMREHGGDDDNSNLYKVGFNFIPL